jgi:DnaB-like helicase N terminal domain
MTTLADLVTSQIPPHSLEAERAILGAAMLDRDAPAQICADLTAGDFYKEGHRKIFAAIASTVERAGVVDVITLSDTLAQMDSLNEIGGSAYLGTLLEEAAILPNLGAYAGIVRDKAWLRDLIRVGTETIGRAYENGQPAGEIAAAASRALEAVSQRAKHGADALEGKALSGPEIMLKPICQPDWAVEGLFSRAHQHMIVASSQGAKTWTLFDLGVALSDPACSHFLGLPIRGHGRVEIESWEQGQAEDIRRGQKIIRGRDLAGGPEDLRLISDPPTTLRDESYFTRRRRELQERGVMYYFADSLSEAAGIELNDNTAYTEFWRTRVKPLLDLGITVVFTHLRGHPKPGVAQDRDSASRGATQIRALSTAVLELRQLTDTLFLVKHNKHRDSTALTFGHLELEGKNEDDWIRLTMREDAGGQGKEALGPAAPDPARPEDGARQYAAHPEADRGRSQRPKQAQGGARLEEGLRGRPRPNGGRRTLQCAESGQRGPLDVGRGRAGRGRRGGRSNAPRGARQVRESRKYPST